MDIKINLTTAWQPVKLEDLANGEPIELSIADKKNRVLLSTDAKGESILAQVYNGSPVSLRVDATVSLFAKADVGTAEKPCELTVTQN